MQRSDWDRYVFELQQYIQNQENRIRSLEEQIRSLIKNQDNKNGMIIERVEYKFDQLKIETLSGSLHIGLSPEDLKHIEDLALEQSNRLDVSHNVSPLDQQVLLELNQWCQSFGPHIIQNLANSYNRKIDDSHQTLLLQDIQKQFPSRITHYKEQAKEQSITNEHELKAFVIEKIQNEVHQSLTKYLEANEGE